MQLQRIPTIRGFPIAVAGPFVMGARRYWLLFKKHNIIDPRKNLFQAFWNAIVELKLRRGELRQRVRDAWDEMAQSDDGSMKAILEFIIRHFFKESYVRGERCVRVTVAFTVKKH